MKWLRNQDVVAALVFGALGAAFVAASLRLDFGTPVDMGPAFFPRVVGSALVVLALVIGARGVAAMRAGAPDETLRLAAVPLLAVFAAVGSFALTLDRLGLIAASLLLVVISAAAAKDRRWREVAVAAVVLSVVTGLLFVHGLKLQARLLPWS